ncbi:DNA-binding CsgD family transcriptional regulator [Kroppenstedtia sanguinis]|uniref:LuxR C-terminal-related transcriptional regulator n=1 Tax=Kroppenstedtia sanguinis TaxID=1380684 RepID=A0ABW4CBI2_9BACL
MQIPAFLTTPLIPHHELQQLMNTIYSGYPEALANWKVKLSILHGSEEEKRSIHELFQFLMRNIGMLPSQSEEFEKKFLHLLRRRRAVLDNSRVILTLGIFEEIIMGLLWKDPHLSEIHTYYRWLHSLILFLTFSVYQEECTKNTDYSGDGTVPDPAGNPDIHSMPSLWQTILRFDELLLTSRSLEELLTDSVRFIVENTQYHRGALFWYSSVTRTVEGIYSYQVDLTKVRQVRALESNIPGIAWAIRETRPIYLQDAKLFFPLYYVKQFRLTSLLACTLYGENKQPAGFLLLDQDGEPFDHPDAKGLRLLEFLIARVSMVLRVKLYESTPLSPRPPASKLLTRREQELLQMIAYGYSTKHIGELLHISEHTAAEYAQTTLKKLNAKNRSEAVAKGFRLGIIQ